MPSSERSQKLPNLSATAHKMSPFILQGVTCVHAKFVKNFIKLRYFLKHGFPEFDKCNFVGEKEVAKLIQSVGDVPLVQKNT